MAQRGCTVVGVDTDAARVKTLSEGKAPFYEPGLRELLQSVKGKFTATSSAREAVLASDISFIMVPTPSDETGGFSLKYVLAACKDIGSSLREKKGFHTIVLTSTVMPGATGGEVKKALENASAKLCGTDFGLCYSPEFVALGSVIQDFLKPDLLLIGESEPRSGELLASLYYKVCENTPPMARMNYVSAELAKLAVNTFVTTKITFANMLARICERIPEADVDAVTHGLGLDSRIGARYLKGAVGYGGPCFPRDNIALSSLARSVGASADLAEVTDRANRREVDLLANLVKSKLPTDGTVGILGLAYKPDTDVVEESQGLQLAQRLLSQGVTVAVYDPAAMDNARKVLKGSIAYSSSVTDCARSSDVIVVTTPWKEFKFLTGEALNHTNGRPTVIDCWRFLTAKDFVTTCEYIPLGRGPQSKP